MFNSSLYVIQTEWDMTPESAIWAIVAFIVWMIFYLPFELQKKRKQDEAYAARKGISYERLLQNRANTAARKISAHTKRLVFEKYNYLCNYCGDGEDLHIDHIFPFSKYRDNSFENLQILCRDCNLKKGNSEPNPKLHPELFGENAKGSMVSHNPKFEDEMTDAQRESVEKIEEVFRNLGKK